MTCLTNYGTSYHNCQINTLQEFEASGINPALAELNFESIQGEAIFTLLYGTAAERRNDGRLTASWLKKYELCLQAEGWVNKATGRFKQTGGEPLSRDEKGKPAKYLTPKGQLAQASFLAIPSDPDFWERVKSDRSIPVVITEGDKKAASLLSQGIVAVSIPGITMGWRSLKDLAGNVTSRKIREELAWLDEEGREIAIAFDYREGDWFKSPEFKNACILSSCFEQATVKIARLPGPEKGIDDFIVRDLDTALNRVNEVLEAAQKATDLQDENLWRKFRGFSPDVRVNQKYFDWDKPRSGEILVVKSGLGTGKTEYARRKIASDEWGKQLNIGYRNSLLIQQSEKWGFYHLHADDAWMMLKDPHGRLSLCVDSLPHIPETAMEDSTLILDEADSVIKHLLSSGTIANKRLECFAQFEKLVRLSGRVVCMSGRVADWIGAFLKELAPEKRLVSVENEYQGGIPPCWFVDAGGKKKSRQTVADLIKSSPRPAIATDSRSAAEAYQRLLEADGRKVLLLSSKTATEPWAKAFLKAPDAYIQKELPDALIFTPTAESGIDISIENYFSEVIGVFFGVVGVDECQQMLRRVRNPEQIYVWAAEKGLPTRSYADGQANFSGVLTAAVTERLSAEAQLLAEGDELKQAYKDAIDSQLASPFGKVWAKQEIKANLERRHLRDYLFKALEEAGFAPRPMLLDESEASDYSEASEACKRQEAEEIFNSQDIPLNDAFEIERNFSAPWTDRCKAIKARLKARLPGIENSPLWSADFIYRIRFEERHLLSQLTNSWMRQNPAEARELQAARWKDLASLRFVGDIRQDWLKVQVLKQLGVEQFLEAIPEGGWSNQSPEVAAFYQACKRKAVVKVLGHPGKQSPMRWLNSCLRFFGAKLKGRRVRLNEKLTWVYDQVQWAENWEELAAMTSENMTQKLEAVRLAQIHEQQGLSPVPEVPEKVSFEGAPGTTQQAPLQDLGLAALTRFDAPETDVSPPWWVTSWVQLADHWERRAELLREIAKQAVRDGLSALELMANVPATVAIEIFETVEAIA